ncbi:MAG TPA: ADP-ribosylglycohydrolase family protein [Porticoccaceae bacterium]|nr:ADP-ribosylglycohydrolase family protein [Porticoccaceae bacterium]
MMIFTGWESPLQLLKMEVVQRAYEGYVVPIALKEHITQLDDENDAMNFEAVDGLFSELAKLSKDPNFTYSQPNDLVNIRKQRPEGPRQMGGLKEADLLDKFHGAWTGRAAGCALGKPVEHMGILGQQGMRGRKAIRTYLENRCQWPLNDYFSGADAGDAFTLFSPQSQRENITYMEPDDDIHYTLIALAILEKVGPSFSWHDIATFWNSCLPYNAICTAESQAILNYNNAVPRRSDTTTRSWVTSDYTSSNRNPYREWIGAQIRADGWGYACAGNPELAAEFAFRDASWTHRANGIYGEMLFAAIVAAAFVENDPYTLVAIGLSEIPKNSKLAEACRNALQQAQVHDDFEGYMDWVDAHYGDLNGVHTVNNALVVIGAMIFGQMDVHQSICRSVEGGLDTDCNGATCGSITGAAMGAKAMDSILVAPLNDTIRPSVIGFQEVTMSDLAERTLQVYRKVSAMAGA